ncbi:unnamed protein product [Durusdinium trenchii]|uniref:Transmembrane protein n=2 Tax=Durusdinium trenchii TaxID=1381693 RepID=A0ABP0LMM6_9DINO
MRPAFVLDEEGPTMAEVHQLWQDIGQIGNPAHASKVVRLALCISYIMIFLTVALLLVLSFKSKEKKQPTKSDEDEVEPVKDIHARWKVVVLDGFLALTCGIPGVAFFSLSYLFVQYSLRSVHRILDQPGMRWWEWLQQLLIESLLWANLAMRCCRDVQVYHGHLLAVAGAVEKNGNAKSELSGAFETMAFDLFGSACFLTSTLLWRILLINMLEVRKVVSPHRTRALNDMKARAKMTWVHFSKICPESFQNLDAQRKYVANMETIRSPLPGNWNRSYSDVALVRVSSLVMLFGMLGLHLEQPKLRQTDWCSITVLPTLWIIGVPTFQATFFWLRITSGVLRLTSEFKDHSNRLLILAALTKPHLPQEWSKANLLALRGMVQEWEEKGNAVGIAVNKKEPVVKEDLELDLAESMDDWWSFRTSLQTDCLDKAAIVEFCSIVIAFLIFNFAAVGLLSWIAYHQIRTIGFGMILALSLALIVIMLRLLEACVATNLLLEADAERLRLASQKLLEPKNDEDKTTKEKETMSLHNKAMLLHAMERSACAPNDRQQLFGIPVTENMRSGWIISLALAFATSAWNVLKSYLGQLDVYEEIIFQVRKWQLAKLLGV